MFCHQPDHHADQAHMQGQGPRGGELQAGAARLQTDGEAPVGPLHNGDVGLEAIILLDELLFKGATNSEKKRKDMGCNFF